MLHPLSNACNIESATVDDSCRRITAVDVCPRHDSVWQCDFLQLQVLPRHKRALREGVAAAWQGQRRERRLKACGGCVRPGLGRQLLGLPAESFDACLLSMVLHHWPQEVQQKALDTAPCPEKKLHLTSLWHRRLLKLRSIGCLSVRASC